MNSRSPTGIPPINFGLCVPAVCTVEMLEPQINQLIQAKLQSYNVGKVYVKLLENTCQFEENASKLKTIDKFAM